MPSKLELVPAAAGKRLGAAVLDWLPPVTVLAILLAIGFAGITRSQSGGFIVYDTSSLVLFGGIGCRPHAGLHRGSGHARRPIRRDPRQPAHGHPQHGCRRLRPGRRSGVPARPHHRRRRAAGRGRRRRRGDLPMVRRGPAGAGTAPVPGRRLGRPRGALQRLGPQRTAPRLARHGRQDPRLRRQSRTQPGHHRRHPGPVQLRAAGPPAGPAGRFAAGRCRSAAGRRAQRRRPVVGGAAGCPPARCRRFQPRCVAARAPQRRSGRPVPHSGVVCAACRVRTVPSSSSQQARIPTTTSTAPRSAATRTPRSPWRCSGSGWTTAATSNWTAPC